MYFEMITTIKKRKILIHKVEVKKLEKNLQFEIRLPANISEVTSILVTTDA